MDALRYRLGDASHHEVYEGECVGLILALHMLSEQEGVSKASIWVDNTAAIQATTSDKCGAAHYLLDYFHSLLQQVRDRHPGLKLRIFWVPSHTGETLSVARRREILSNQT
ncbi:hypothetical protein K435DRAFT_652787 [Dendrothele bispora CBS 962.96]|uniref:RNase H type-1 domain-containing protein n=1 Tax=Dendrothele bispora (strain CBS 962.96) TaxID=1314807 RepID=A0A4S8LLH9_DENBC|nr:hypothetical protein K435DRAFT_676612 [Dendrothele bispora CBS 962.96]THV02697.1 hypothetical protein K435DRAFT_652787 [Dendrothele bispora CBS 962.96]